MLDQIFQTAEQAADLRRGRVTHLLAAVIGRIGYVEPFLQRIDLRHGTGRALHVLNEVAAQDLQGHGQRWGDDEADQPIRLDHQQHHQDDQKAAEPVAPEEARLDDELQKGQHSGGDDQGQDRHL